MLMDSSPIIYTLEAHPQLAARYKALFARHAAGEFSLAVTTITIAEVLTGPLGAGEDALAKRYRAVLESWHVVELTADIAETAARLRARHKLKLPDAIQLASALAINAHALVTHDRDFAKVRGIRVVG
ncbi:MAG: PIN domain-containing protein [Betaproteobacteria bacterium]|nr:PIN domain-containing protein [Betaproteobacteria bacterium]MBK9606534.1 PIN domain-containing protein [Betaproteobacteria bacterium]